MKKVVSKILPVILALVMLTGIVTGCKKPENKSPEILGVSDGTATVGVAYDALSGVTAADEEDGDITNKIVITSVPAVEITDGMITFTETGIHSLTYSVEDSKGATAEAYSEVDVAAAPKTATVFKTFTFNDAKTVNVSDWSIDDANDEAAIAAENGRLKVNVPNIGSAADDVVLWLPTIENTAENTNFVIDLYMSASKSIKFNLDAIDDGGASVLSEKAEAALSSYAKKTFEVTTDGETDTLDIALELGAISGQATGGYNLYIELAVISVVPVTGDEFDVAFDGGFNLSNVINAAWAESQPGGVCGVSATVADSKLKVAIDHAEWGLTGDSYYTNGDNRLSFGIKTNISIKPETSYRIEISMTSNYDMPIREFVTVDVGDKTNLDPKAQVGDEDPYNAYRPFKFFFDGAKTKLTANVPFVINDIYTPDGDFVSADNLVFALMGINNPNYADVNDHVLTISKLKVTEVIPPQFATVTKKFKGLDNTTQWNSFSSRYDENFGAGVGTAYYNDGKLYYRMNAASSETWHNKLFSKKFALNALDTYRLTFSIKASAASVGAKILFLPVQTEFAPVISQVITITNTTQEFSFDTGMIMAAKDYEIVIELGSSANQALGEVLIEISAFTVYKLG